MRKLLMRFGVRCLNCCGHKRLSFPITLDRDEGAYVVCLDCGAEFRYSWAQMRVTGRRLPLANLYTREARG